MTWQEWQEKHWPHVAMRDPICPAFALEHEEKPCKSPEVCLSGDDPCEICRLKQVPKAIEGSEDNG